MKPIHADGFPNSRADIFFARSPRQSLSATRSLRPVMYKDRLDSSTTPGNGRVCLIRRGIGSRHRGPSARGNFGNGFLSSSCRNAQVYKAGSFLCSHPRTHCRMASPRPKAMVSSMWKIAHPAILGSPTVVVPVQHGTGMISCPRGSNKNL